MIPSIVLVVTFAALAWLTSQAPAEASLGSNVRIVYLHGAWVWAALVCFAASGLSGLGGLLLRRLDLQRWSLAFGRTGLLFWVAYLPLSAWASQMNWNGLFLAEPRWRMALIFAVTGILIQAGIWLISLPNWGAAINAGFAATLFLTLAFTPRILHPESPIFSSDSSRIQLFFIGLIFLSLVAALQIAVLLLRWEIKTSTPPGKPASLEA